MEQIAFFDMKPPYKYIIDTSSILSQKDNEIYRRDVYKRKWVQIDELIRKHEIITCCEVIDEIYDENILTWIKSLNCKVLKIDTTIQQNVIKVVTKHPILIDFKHTKSSGDAFIIATAMKYNLTVVTEEKENSPKKIPFICKSLNIPCVNILGLCIKEGWIFD